MRSFHVFYLTVLLAGASAAAALLSTFVRMTFCFPQEELEFCERLRALCFQGQQSEDNGMDR